jgi:hypothetical protein
VHCGEKGEAELSSYLYGSITRKRLDTQSDAPLVYAQAGDEKDLKPLDGDDPTKETVSHWQDTLAALVPAEVLAFHGVAMTLGTTTSGKGDETTTVITNSQEMLVVYWVLVGAAFVLYLFGAKSFKTADFLRALVAALAFILWTMIQPSTAFDALDWNPSTLVRVMTALVGAALLGLFVNVLATNADKATKATKID